MRDSMAATPAFCWRAVVALALTTLLVLTGNRLADAQESVNPIAYWEHTASGRLEAIHTADITGDGMQELLVSDANGQLTMLWADGQQAWSLLLDEPATVIGSVDVISGDGGRQEIVVAGENSLSLIDSVGRQIWQKPLNVNAAVVEVSAYDFGRDGTEDILVLLSSGQLLAYNASGQPVWQFAGQEDIGSDVDPQMIVADFDADGEREIVLGLFTPRRFSQLLFIDDDTVRWRQSISRRITALAEAPFEEGPKLIAVGTNFGQVDLYDPSGNLVWFRTVNRPISALSFAELQDEPVLVVGTAAGSVIAYSADGRRLWANNLDRSGSRSVLALSTAVGQAIGGQPSIAASLDSASSPGEAVDLFLLGSLGQTLARLSDTDLPNITRLVDINGDGYEELLLGRFATLQLQGLGVGESEYTQEWEYDLDAVPSATLIADLDGDEESDILIGTRDGRLHSLSHSRQLRWLHSPGNEIAFLAQLRGTPGSTPRIVVVRRQNDLSPNGDGQTTQMSWIELREANGERVWETVVPHFISALLVDDRSLANSGTIYVATDDGHVLAYDASGLQVWSQQLSNFESGIRDLILPSGNADQRERLLVVGEYNISTLTNLDGLLISTGNATFDSPIVAAHAVRQPGQELAVRLVVFLQNGTVHGLNRSGIELGHLGWPVTLGSPVEVVAPGRNNVVEIFQEDLTAFLVGTVDGALSQLTVVNSRPDVTWQMEGIGPVEALSWDMADQEGRPGIGLIGTLNGQLQVLERLQTRNPRPSFQLPLSRGIAGLSLLNRTSSQSPDLLAMSENGRVRLFREKENRPPLLTRPSALPDQRDFNVEVGVRDVENDVVTLSLELFDPATESWVAEGEQQLETGVGTVSWTGVSAMPGSSEFRYRMRFDDGFYSGVLNPPQAPPVPVVTPLRDATPVLAALLGIVLVVLTFVFARQVRSPSAQAGRFYGNLRRNPEQTLQHLEQQYARVNGSPDFLLQLANSARRASDNDTANLADGLFLLENRPQAGLSIITRTLDDAAHRPATWNGLEHRRLAYRTGQSLLEAPSTTELSLMRPQLVHLLSVLDAKDEWSPILDSLLPVLANIRDSERVDSAEDRLVYLTQAAVRLRQIEEQSADYSPTVERTLARAIARRWSGLLAAEIEEQRGRAELEVSLKTKRIVPNGQTHVAIEIRNRGRAAAENIIARLEENLAYHVYSEPQVIPFLPSGRTRQVRFLIEPHAEEHFRVGLSLTYDDRNRREKTTAFGDMVHLLPPVREFIPISNPYLPGTALRKDSSLFYGREELFDFIAENTGTHSQRNVLMLVGQRRTGKTSALLRLEEYLPSHLVPVYIDCQSLGVSPGMPVLLQEFAWYIADTLAARGINCSVPDAKAWQEDPARTFQRVFLAEVRRLLPANYTLLLIFDEFEAFEAMVRDDILPKTFFTYMRHLMQHTEGLGFIFVGTRRLEEMSADYWSVLFNIALYRKIDFLSEAAAKRLICEPVAPAIIYDDLAIDKIIRVTAGHPYFLQLVCYTLVKRANQERTGYVTISDVNDALDEMLKLGEVHFAYLWQRSTPAERALLVAAAQLMDRNEPLHPGDLTNYLLAYGVELDPATATGALNGLVQRDIMREVTEEGLSLYELRIGLVGQWVAQNKGLSRLHAHLAT